MGARVVDNTIISSYEGIAVAAPGLVVICELLCFFQCDVHISIDRLKLACKVEKKRDTKERAFSIISRPERVHLI